MNYFQFKRTIQGNLALIGKFSDEYDLCFDNGNIWISENDIKNIKDNFLIKHQRVVKNGKTWYKNYINRKTASYFY